jgi:hypothetical protein
VRKLNFLPRYYIKEILLAFSVFGGKGFLFKSQGNQKKIIHKEVQEKDVSRKPEKEAGSH